MAFREGDQVRVKGSQVIGDVVRYLAPSRFSDDPEYVVAWNGNLEAGIYREAELEWHDDGRPLLRDPGTRGEW